LLGLTWSRHVNWDGHVFLYRETMDTESVGIFKCNICSICGVLTERAIQTRSANHLVHLGILLGAGIVRNTRAVSNVDSLPSSCGSNQSLPINHASASLQVPLIAVLSKPYLLGSFAAHISVGRSLYKAQPPLLACTATQSVCNSRKYGLRGTTMTERLRLTVPFVTLFHAHVRLVGSPQQGLYKQGGGGWISVLLQTPEKLLQSGWATGT
jgi:hypothetical protein